MPTVLAVARQRTSKSVPKTNLTNRRAHVTAFVILAEKIVTVRTWTRTICANVIRGKRNGNLRSNLVHVLTLEFKGCYS